MSPRVKVCGLRRVADAELAIELGATDLGCVLAPDSPRAAQASEVRAIRDAARGRARVVLVFRDQSPGEIIELAALFDIRDVQVHGRCEPGVLAAGGLNVWNVVAVERGAATLPALVPAPAAATPAVYDCGRGGGGTPFPWHLLGPRAPHATFIAGGITPLNVAALLEYAPYGIDVSSGIESAPGIKDAGKLHALYAELGVKA